MRLRFPETGYPFKALILNNLRAKESGLFGAHYYILAALALAALWLTRDPASWPHAIPAVIAVIAVTVFADSASALVGVRWGRMRWPHNHGKTLVGTAGGTFVAFAVALPFVGPIAAAAAGIAFMVVDIAAPVPVPVSDNLLNPIVLAATFTLLGPWLAPLIPFY
jgi:dolichol kinase